MSRTVRELRRVGAYIRVSTEMQVDGYSLASQESEVREYCDRDRGLTLAELYVEKGESACRCSAKMSAQVSSENVLP